MPARVDEFCGGDHFRATLTLTEGTPGFSKKAGNTNRREGIDR
jgi:hypothetical protein